MAGQWNPGKIARLVVIQRRRITLATLAVRIHRPAGETLQGELDPAGRIRDECSLLKLKLR